MFNYKYYLLLAVYNTPVSKLNGTKIQNYGKDLCKTYFVLKCLRPTTNLLSLFYFPFSAVVAFILEACATLVGPTRA